MQLVRPGHSQSQLESSQLLDLQQQHMQRVQDVQVQKQQRSQPQLQTQSSRKPNKRKRPQGNEPELTDQELLESRSQAPLFQVEPQLQKSWGWSKPILSFRSQGTSLKQHHRTAPEVSSDDNIDELGDDVDGLGDKPEGSSSSFPSEESTTYLKAEESSISTSSTSVEMRQTVTLNPRRRELKTNKKLRQRTLSQYMQDLTRWDDFCLDHGMDNLVEPEKVAKFLKKAVFTRTKAVITKARSVYDGIIGKTEHDPEENPSAAEEEAVQVKARFLEATERGECSISVPIDKELVEETLMALVHEWNEQKSTRENYSENPRNAPEVVNVIAAYLRKLVVNKVPRTFCSQREGYDTECFYKLMAVLWKGEYPKWNKRMTFIRDRAAINLGHQMLLRDEEIRHLDLANCFSESVTTPLYKTTRVIHGLSFRLCKNTPQENLDKDCSLIFRHNDHLRCGVGAFAFYLFERFQVGTLIIGPTCRL
ncbi:hypothetical protein BGX27_000510 [Mortierella sp. AM989]|nr:hypothetical protein BGX27_000510 [Mortierella sp. AM989]